ncbi:hypothetical protein E3N88_44986 [Mikania micrantha]|uniref:Uncharacterized protein n=1 Tax=Mikania micrantha TaxID=192012 RepID=A0A5N6LCT3_9ASTR|nr:hypothetical protein E3N88_44986 [Mikania micrantha]
MVTTTARFCSSPRNSRAFTRYSLGNSCLQQPHSFSPVKSHPYIVSTCSHYLPFAICIRPLSPSRLATVAVDFNYVILPLRAMVKQLHVGIEQAAWLMPLFILFVFVYKKQKDEISIEDITYKLEGLGIYEGKERKTLVPCRGNDALIPIESVKKRKPRPKVDLDPETDRLWRLLMGNEGSEATETVDKDKENLWEDERRVFRGQADSKCTLFSGDGRFSRWKGSVVDSVIDVFVTQNVSDHLPSSAFMSLAARFNPKTRSTNKTHCTDGACILVEESIETLLPTNKIRRHPVFNQRPYVSYGSSDHMRPNRNTILSTNYAANKQNTLSEELIISQDSLDFSTIQTVDECISSSGSNSEIEDQKTEFKISKKPHTANHMRAEKTALPSMKAFMSVFSPIALNLARVQFQTRPLLSLVRAYC